jgi:molybdenum cofactor biosynthesis enzyme MoaA
MACNLLHIVERQDPRPYEDSDVKDVVGALPQFFCTHCNPLKRLLPGEAMKCLAREAPCWMPPERICAERG